MNNQIEMTYNEWLELADEYYLATRSLLYFSTSYHPLTYLGHHTLELYLKAICFNYTKEYNKNSHNLKDLYDSAKKCYPKINHISVESAINSYANYEEVSRYTIKNSKTKSPPLNGSMGSNELKALDRAVSILRDLSIETKSGLDKIMEGRSRLLDSGLDDTSLYLNSYILFHENSEFIDRNQKYINKIKLDVPKYNLG